MEFLISILVVYGLTNIIVQGSIFNGVKEWLTEKAITRNPGFIKWGLEKFITLINCPMCTGFWVGVFVGWFFGPFVYWNILFNGALYSGTTWVITSFVQFLGNGDDPSRSVVIMTDEPIAIKDINKEESDND